MIEFFKKVFKRPVLEDPVIGTTYSLDEDPFNPTQVEVLSVRQGYVLYRFNSFKITSGEDARIDAAVNRHSRSVKSFLSMYKKVDI